MEFKAAFIIGFRFKLSGTLNDILGSLLRFLLLGHELLDFFLRRLGAIFSRFCSVFCFLQTFFLGDKTGFDSAEIHLSVG